MIDREKMIAVGRSKKKYIEVLYPLKKVAMAEHMVRLSLDYFESTNIIQSIVQQIGKEALKPLSNCFEQCWKLKVGAAPYITCKDWRQ